MIKQMFIVIMLRDEQFEPAVAVEVGDGDEEVVFAVGLRRVSCDVIFFDFLPEAVRGGDHVELHLGVRDGGRCGALPMPIPIPGIPRV